MKGLVMNKEIATKVFESLASGIRLDVWRLLVKAGLEGLVAGQLANELDIAPNTLSFHLKAMLHAGLLSVEQEGRFLRYRANIPLMLSLIGYLTEECCAGHPEACGVMSRVRLLAPCIACAALLQQGNAMSVIQVFDPALCCASGVWGPGRTAPGEFCRRCRLGQIAGVAIERFNLAQQPIRFAETPAVSAFLTHAGGEGLPWCWWMARWCSPVVTPAALNWPVMPVCPPRRPPSRGSSRVDAAQGSSGCC